MPMCHQARIDSQVHHYLQAVRGIQLQVADYLPDGCEKSLTNSYSWTLPPELWLKIFAFLSYIPGALSISDYGTIEAFSEDSEGIILRELYDETMKDKLAISQVSWMFRKLVLPSLFEYVLISSRRHAKNVAGALSRFRMDQDRDDYYGRWVKRVEVSAEDMYWERENTSILCSILDNTPNISVFSDFFGLNRRRAGAGIIKRLHALCEEGHLRRIEWSGAADSSLFQLLRGTPSLQVLISRQLTRRPAFLPSLKVLIIRTGKPTYSSVLENFQASGLRSLVMHSPVFLSSCPSSASIHTSFPKLQRLRWLYDHASEYEVDICGFEGLTVLTIDIGPRRGDFEQLKKIRIKHRALDRLNIVHLPYLRPHYDRVCCLEETQLVSEFMLSLLDAENNSSLKSIGFFVPKSYFGSLPEAEMDVSGRTPIAFEEFWRTFTALSNTRGIKVEASLGADAHFRSDWKLLHISMLPRAHCITGG